jgi:hypothetical protein
LFWPCHANGRSYAAYVEIDGMTVNAATRTSDDEGATWSQSSIFASGLNDVVAFSDPSCVANGANVWVEYATTAKHVPDPEMQMEQLNSVWVAQSTNSGASFGAAIQSADKTTDKVFLHPVLVREPNGTLDITMYGGKSNGDTQSGVRYTHPLTSAKTIFQPLTFAVDRTTADWLGDYIGATTRNGYLDTSFTANATGNSHIAYVRTKLP